MGRSVCAWGGTGAIFLSTVVQLSLRADESGLKSERMLIEGAFIAPLSEEIFKALPLILALLMGWARGRRQFLVLGALSGLGFAFTEDLISLAGEPVGQAWATQLGQRVILRGGMHAFFTGFTGLGIGFASNSRTIVKKWAWILAGLFAAFAMHCLNNTFGVAAMDGLVEQGTAAANRLYLFLLFFYLVVLRRGRRQLLRRGPIV